MKKSIKRILNLAVFSIVLGLVYVTPISASDLPTYTISTDSGTYNGNMMNYSTYNAKTKHYYLLRSYLERLEATGGGTLVLSKGTYTITNTLYVPSNVTIELKDGVEIVKGTDSGTSTFSASNSIFQLIRPSLANEEGVYGKYDGEKNIRFIGSGSATINMAFAKDNISIIAGHNQNVTIENIRFENMYSGHFIEMDATKNATIRNNTFMNSKASSQRIKEAINLDTPDKATGGWSLKWSTFDRTPNSDIVIEHNTFYNLDRAIGTHNYSEGMYHDQIIIRHNNIEKSREDAIRAMNWRNAIVEDNFIKDVEPGDSNNNRAILGSGVINPTFRNNTFVSVPRPMQFMVTKDNGYDISENQIGDKNIHDFSTNTIVDYEEDFVRINNVYNKFDKANTDYINVRTSLFSDLKSGDSGYDETISLVERKIVNGYPDHTFKPYDVISRKHVAVLLTKALNLSIPENISEVLSKYHDVDENTYYAEQIAAVTQEGIFNGNNGWFNPDKNITRSQMATVLVGAFDLEENHSTVELNDLEDIDISHRDNVKVLAQNDITIGKPSDNGGRYFDGLGHLTRVQFAVFLHRTLNISE